VIRAPRKHTWKAGHCAHGHTQFLVLASAAQQMDHTQYRYKHARLEHGPRPCTCGCLEGLGRCSSQCIQANSRLVAAACTWLTGAGHKAAWHEHVFLKGLSHLAIPALSGPRIWPRVCSGQPLLFYPVILPFLVTSSISPLLPHPSGHTSILGALSHAAILPILCTSP